MDTRSRKRVFSLVDSDIQKNINIKIQKKNNSEVEKEPNSVKPINKDNVEQNVQKDVQKDFELKENYLTQYETNKITYDQFFEHTKLMKGYILIKKNIDVNTNIYNDIPICLRNYYYSILDIITNNKNLVNEFDNKEQFMNFLNLNKDNKYFLYCEDINDKYIYKIYNLDKSIGKMMYSNENRYISSFVNQINDTYILQKNINVKDIYHFAYSYFDTNSIYITEKVKLIDDFYTSFELDKNRSFTRIEIYDIFLKYIKNNNLGSKCKLNFIVMDNKLGKLLNTYFPIHFNLFNKLIRQLIIQNESTKIDNYYMNTPFSDFRVNISQYMSKNTKNGLYRKYNEKGDLILETYFIKNKAEGICRKWDDNGKLRCMIEYHNNLKDGSQIIYDETENIISEFVFKQDKLITYSISERYN